MCIFQVLKNLMENVRPLNDMEIGQIAGRAGRYTKSGYFGSTLGAKFTNLIRLKMFKQINLSP